MNTLVGIWRIHVRYGPFSRRSFSKRLHTQVPAHSCLTYSAKGYDVTHKARPDSFSAKRTRQWPGRTNWGDPIFFDCNDDWRWLEPLVWPYEIVLKLLYPLLRYLRLCSHRCVRTSQNSGSRIRFPFLGCGRGNHVQSFLCRLESQIRRRNIHNWLRRQKNFFKF